MNQNNQNIKKGAFPYALLLFIGLALLLFYNSFNNNNKVLDKSFLPIKIIIIDINITYITINNLDTIFFIFYIFPSYYIHLYYLYFFTLNKNLTLLS